jgi:hypothetical protein
MKKAIILSLCLFAILGIGCKKYSICPDGVQYHLFTENEISNIWINIDSAIYLQNKLESIPDQDMYYSEFETICFVNELNDTLSFYNENTIGPGHNEICSNDKPMIAYSFLNALDENFIHYIRFDIEKTIVDTRPIIKTLDFKFENGLVFYSSFSINDTISLDNNTFNNVAGTVYFSVLKEDIEFNNILISNCFIFKFYDEAFNDLLSIQYSNKYGFLQITKNNEHEIKRII